MSTCQAPTASLPLPRSGGPRTAEGKENSRRNSLKRGLRSKIVFPDDLADLIEVRVREFTDEFKPRTPFEVMLVRDMAVSSARFERCASLSVADLVRSADRAHLCWEQDRWMSVEDYAVKLPKDPRRISRGLRKTRQGADWLIDHWESLAAIARENGGWDDDQRRLAFDLLGVPHHLRPGTYKVPRGDDAANLISLAESQIAELRDDLEAVLDDLNDAERAMAMAGMPMEEDKITARLRKDEARARNDFNKARNALMKHREAATVEEPESSDDRPALSNATINHLVERSRCPMFIEEPEVGGSPESASPEPARRGPNRRARKEQARRARVSAAGSR